MSSIDFSIRTASPSRTGSPAWMKNLNQLRDKWSIDSRSRAEEIIGHPSCQQYSGAAQQALNFFERVLKFAEAGHEQTTNQMNKSLEGIIDAFSNHVPTLVGNDEKIL